MMRSFLSGGSAPRALGALAVAVALTGCGGDMSVNPAAPSFQFPTQSPTLGTMRTLEITGSLTTLQGSCFEATILYDGQELAGARAMCADASGCARLDLAGVVRTASGRHVISFQVLRQSSEALEYLAEATVRMSRDNLSLTLTLPLEPARAALRAGQTVTFQVDFQDTLG